MRSTSIPRALAPERTMQAYRTIYFPAQEIHWMRDKPRNAADLIINNDPLLSNVALVRDQQGACRAPSLSTTTRGREAIDLEGE